MLQKTDAAVRFHINAIQKGQRQMAIRQVRTIGDDILRKECKPVKEITPRIAELIEDMFETMYEVWQHRRWVS